MTLYTLPQHHLSCCDVTSRLWTRLHVWKRSAASAFVFSHLHPLSWQVPPLHNLVPDAENAHERLSTPVNDTGAAAAPAKHTNGTQNASYRYRPLQLHTSATLPVEPLPHCLPLLVGAFKACAENVPQDNARYLTALAVWLTALRSCPASTRTRMQFGCRHRRRQRPAAPACWPCRKARCGRSSRCRC